MWPHLGALLFGGIRLRFAEFDFRFEFTFPFRRFGLLTGSGAVGILRPANDEPMTATFACRPHFFIRRKLAFVDPHWFSAAGTWHYHLYLICTFGQPCSGNRVRSGLALRRLQHSHGLRTENDSSCGTLFTREVLILITWLYFTHNAHGFPLKIR